MIYLLLAIISSAFVSITMRFSDKHVTHTMIMFTANYLICTVLSACFGFLQSVPSSDGGFGFAAFLGLISGFMYLASFMLLQKNIRENGVVLPATFMKLGVLVPTLMAILIFHEQPGIMTVIGFCIAIVAIIIINGKSRQNEKHKTGLLLLLLISGGFTDSLANIYDKTGVSDLKDFYLMITFAMACLLCILLAIYKKQSPNLTDIGWGLLIGIPNYFSSRFLLLALNKMPAVIIYPAQNVGAILVVSLAGKIGRAHV